MKLRSMRSALALASVVCAAVLFTAPEAKALTITVDSISKVSPNTPTALYFNNSTGGTLLTSGSSSRQSSYDSAVSILDPGGTTANLVGNSVDAKTRYASAQTSDSDGLFSGDATLETKAAYTVTLSVSGSQPGATYSVKIDTARIGAFVIRDETSASGSNNLGAVVGTFASPNTGLTSLAALAGQNQSGTGTAAFNQPGTDTITGLTGDATFSLTFSWTGRTQSSSGANGGDESVILMGQVSGINGDVGAADDYPGTSGRIAANDGHFVTLTATLTTVPEPSTLALAGIGLAFGGLTAWRRRKTA